MSLNSMDIMDSQWMCQKNFGVDGSKPKLEPVKQTLCQLLKGLNDEFCDLNGGISLISEVEHPALCPLAVGNFAVFCCL